MCTLARIIATSLDASDVIPQPPPSTALSRHVSGCHPSVQADVIPHHSPRQALCSAIMSAAVTLQGVTVEVPGEMRRDVGSDLVFPLFPGRVGGQRQPSGRSAYKRCFGRRESSMRHQWPNHRRRCHCIRFPTVGYFLQRWWIISLCKRSRRVTPRI